MAIPQIPWIDRKKVEISLPVAAWNLGNGESAVFSFAMNESGYRAVVDYLAARRCAQAFGIQTLGTGGLLRAYGDTAAQVLDAASVEERILRDRIRLRFSYDDTSPAMHTISQFDARILETHYTDETEILVGVRRSEVESFIDTFVNALGGRGVAERVNGGEGERGNG